jgi:hypothetical protein
VQLIIKQKANFRIGTIISCPDFRREAAGRGMSKEDCRKEKNM